MSKSHAITPAARPIKAYYEALRDLAAQDVDHESAVRSAFQTLLAELARAQKWTAIPELGKKVRVSGKRTRIIPDGTVKDRFQLPRGYWEAKDTADDLDAEIIEKAKKGYPLDNSIFWTPTRAVLFQAGEKKLDVQIEETNGQPGAFCDLLSAFFNFVDKPIVDFDEAVEEFTTRVPEVGKKLAAIIEDAHKSNRRFKDSFTAFFDLCRTTLNPNISQVAVDEMLVQHLLTERLFYTVFGNPQFLQRNVIAAEVEKIVQALASHAFSRQEFLRSLDRFYVAIENAAARVKDWSSKQTFLNAVYERFFQGYCVKTADTHGIVYTPQPIVNFMCASVEWVLKEEFGKQLGDKGVNILDPCTGTGNFVINLMRRAEERGKKHLLEMYRHQLFANEIMLMPYYIASLNIEHEFFDLNGEYEAFEGLCFVDTLELAEPKHTGLFTEANLARVERQKKAPIEIIIGNPPYNVGQMTHNEQNQNRPYPTVDHWVKHSYAADSQATSVSKLNDPYVKFFRWATRRLEDRDGIVCFVSNSAFVENIAYDGMRKHLARDFQAIYHLDLEGNVRQNPTLSGTQYNVFGIQVGVGITVCVKRAHPKRRGLFYANVKKDLRREDKLEWLNRQESAGQVKWRKLKPDARNNWLVPANGHEFAECVPIATKDGRSQDNGVTGVIFKDYSLGIASHRDSVVYDFSRDSLLTRIKSFIEAYNTEVDRWKRAPKDAKLDAYVRQEGIVWDEDLKRYLDSHRYLEFDKSAIRTVLWRPGCKRWAYLTRGAVARVYGMIEAFPPSTAAQTNRAVAFTGFGSERPFMAHVLSEPTDLHLVGAGSGAQCLPFYVYNEDGSHRRENITDWALTLFRDHFGATAKKLTKWDIFNYVYALLHHPKYRETFTDNLKRELPRIPLAKTFADFRAFVAAGEALSKLHLNYDDPKTVKPFALKEVWMLIGIDGRRRPKSWRVDDKMRLNKEKTALTVNSSLTLTGIPQAVYRYKLGNRSALEWVIDQYQVSTDKRTGIVSDCNAWGEERNDEEYIVRLVKQVVTVSLKTMKLIDALPKNYGGPPTVPLDAPGAARAQFALAEPRDPAAPKPKGALKLRGQAPARQRRLRD